MIYLKQADILSKNFPDEEDLYKNITVKWENSPVPGSFFVSQIFSDFTKNLEEWAVNDPEMLKYFGEKSLSEGSGFCYGRY